MRGVPRQVSTEEDAKDAVAIGVLGTDSRTGTARRSLATSPPLEEGSQ